MKKNNVIFLSLCYVLLLTACQAKCPPERISYLVDPTLFPPMISDQELETELSSVIIEIKGEEIQIDRVITGPVCNDEWSGQVYVTCDIQIPAWEGDPFFFQDCDLEIGEDAVVYVEAHNDKLYDKGCSCHE